MNLILNRFYGKKITKISNKHDGVHYHKYIVLQCHWLPVFCVGSLLSFISCSGSGGTDTPIGVAPPEDGKDDRLVAFGSAAFTAASFNTGSIIIHVDLWYRLEMIIIAIVLTKIGVLHGLLC